MEEPGPPMSDLFEKMKQLFPEIPLPVIQFNVQCYGHDPPMCQHMLELHRRYLASSSSGGASPIVNQLLGLNLNSSPESATGEGVNHRPKSANKHPLNQNQEFQSYSPRFQQITNIPVSVSTELKGINRNFSYAGMSTSPPQILIPNILSAPIASVDFQSFNNAYDISSNHLQSLNQPTSAGRSVSPNAAFVSTSGASSSTGVQTSSSDVPSHALDRNRIAWGTYHTTNSPLIKAPYDSQLFINVDPYYNYTHYPNVDQRPHSTYANVHLQNTISQHPVQPNTNFVFSTSDHTNSPFIQNDLFCSEEQRPQLYISPSYWNKNYNSNLQNVPLNGQKVCVGQVSVPSASNTAFVNHYMQENLHRQTSKLNAVKYEILQNRTAVGRRKSEIQKLEQQLKYKTYLPDKKMVQDMKDEISKLRVECHYLCMEVDLQLKGEAPLGMVDEDFYRTIFTGQQGPLLPATTQGSPSSPSPTVDPRQARIEEEEENKESSTWECNRCTFANHPAISVCEMCHIPRSTLPGLSESEILLKLDPSDGGAL